MTFITTAMNFLAHLYLSGESTDIQIGNFIGDYVKGSHYLNYRESVKEGILLHRAIDHFTDQSDLVAMSKEYFKPVYGRYAGIVCDLLYDHFLALEWNHYSSHSLNAYTRSVHKTLIRNFMILPGRVQQFLPFLIKNRRLESYATSEGFIRALEVMSTYTSLPPYQHEVTLILTNNFPKLQDQFRSFMKEVILFVEEQKGIQIHRPGKTNP